MTATIHPLPCRAAISTVQLDTAVQAMIGAVGIECTRLELKRQLIKLGEPAAPVIEIPIGCAE